MELVYKNYCRAYGSYILQFDTKFLPYKSFLSGIKNGLKNEKLLDELVKKYGKAFFFATGHRKPFFLSGEDAMFLASRCEKKNRFYVWVSRLKEWDNQRNVKVSYVGKPDKTYVDRENSNIIDFFDLSDGLGRTSKIRMRFSLDRYETRLEESGPAPKKYKRNTQLYKTYTRPEMYLEQTDEVKKRARRIVGSEKAPFERARKIYDWIIDKITYVDPSLNWGVIPALRDRCGDCGDYNCLFIALCRSLGIPSRNVVGIWMYRGFWGQLHEWAEFYLNGVGWLPVDPSIAQSLKNREKKFIKLMRQIRSPTDYTYYFGNLDNRRITFSKGWNILLKNYPEKSHYMPLMEDRRSVEMQPSSIYPFVGSRRKGVYIINKKEWLDVTRKENLDYLLR